MLNTDRLVHIVSRLPGVVREVRKHLGDTVRAGDILAVIDSRELADAKAAYLAVSARVTVTEDTLAREKDLWEKKISAAQDYLTAKQALAEARIELRAAKHKLSALGVSEASLQQLASQPDSSLTRYEIVAPSAGTVIEKRLTVGELLKDDTETFLVADLNTLWVHVNVSPSDLPLIRLGQRVTTTAGAAVPEATGTISYLGSLVSEETRTVLARVVLPNPHGRWRPGLFVTATVAVGDTVVPLLIPKAALQTLDGQPSVFVQTSEGFEPRAVTLGQSNATHAEITAGMPGWQRDGTYLTPEGQRLSTALEQEAYLRTVQDWIIRPQLKGLEGVAGIDVIGGYIKQYHVQPDPAKLVAYGLTFRDLIEALERNNVSTSAGYIEQNGEAYLVRADDRIANAEHISGMVVSTRQGIPITMRAVATVGIGQELRTGSASVNGSEAVIGTAIMLTGANSRTVAAAVDAKMQQVSKTLPRHIRATTVMNRSSLVNATITTVRNNLAEGAILVIVLLFLMLGNLRAALITALAIPLAMLMTAIGMVQARISGNLMSLGAIDFGLIVDGAVIIVENCLRHLAERQHALGRPLSVDERLHEVWVASAEMVQPSVFGQAIIITVYLPILTLTGVEGKMFQPMAMTVIFALVAAFLLSLTFVPAMVALGVRGQVREQDNLLVRLAKRLYAPVLGLALRRRWLVVLLALAACAGALLLFGRLGQEFMPTLDEHDIAIEILRIPSTSLTQSTRMQLQVEKTLSTFPEVALVFSKMGTAEMATDPMPPNGGDAFVVLKPRAQWPEPDKPKRALLRRMDASLDRLLGSSYEFTQPIQMRFNELLAGVRSDVAVKVYGDNFHEMRGTAEAIARVLQSVPGAADVKVEQTTGLPVLHVRSDRAAIARYGLSAAAVQEVVAIAVGGREAGLVFEGDRRFPLVVRLPEHLRQNLEALRTLPIPLPRRENDDRLPRMASVRPAAVALDRPTFIPLGEVARFEVSEGPNQISRDNGKRRVVAQANIRGRDLGSFVADAQRRIETQVKLPPGSWLGWGGQFENLVAARQRLILVVPGCFFLIFLLLFSAFNAVRYALLVFTGVPLALTGGIVALWLRGMPFSISAAVGFIALSGVAVLNGLVIVTYINQLRRDGVGLNEAIVQGSLTRLRPVLMTAMVASLGFVPMALATGTGAEVQKPLATVVIGGLVSSTLLTLVVLPALYRLFGWGEASKEEM